MKKKRISLWLAIFCLLLSSTVVMAQEQVTLQFMGWEESPLETQAVLNGLDRFMELNPHIKVEYTPVAGEYDAKLLTMMAGNAAPDVFFMESGAYREFVKRGTLLNLSEYFKRDGLEIEEFIPIAQEKMLIGDEVYGLSSCNVSPVLLYNKDIFDEAGIAYPPSNPDEAWTWDEFVDVTRELTIEENGRTVQYGVYGLRIDWGHLFPVWVKSNGGEVFNEDYTELLLDSPEAKEALVEVRKMFVDYEHGVCPTATNLEQTGMSAAQMLQTGRIAMLVDGSWAIQELATMGFPLGIAVMPKFKELVTIGQAHLHSAWEKTDHPEEAWKLVKYLSSREYQTNLIREGLWLPNRMDMYEDENIDDWFNPEVYPEEFRKAVPLFTEYGELWSGVIAPSEAMDIINEELDNFFLDRQDIDEVIDRMKRRVDPILQNQ